MNQRRLPAINCRPAKVGFVSGISPSNFGLDSGQAIIKGDPAPPLFNRNLSTRRAGGGGVLAVVRLVVGVGGLDAIVDRSRMHDLHQAPPGVVGVGDGFRAMGDSRRQHQHGPGKARRLFHRFSPFMHFLGNFAQQLILTNGRILCKHEG